MRHRQHSRRVFRSTSSLVITAVMAASLGLLGGAPAMAADEPTTSTPSTTESSTTPGTADTTAPAPSESTTPSDPSAEPTDPAATTDDLAPAPEAKSTTESPNLSALAATSFVCQPGSVYSLGGGGNIWPVSASGASSTWTRGNSPGDLGNGNYNGLGIGKDGQTAYAFDRNSSPLKVVTVNVQTGAAQKTVNAPSSLNLEVSRFIGGAVDPSTGIYYFGGWSNNITFVLWKYNPSNDAITQVGKFKPTTDVGSGNGDIAFNSNGDLFVLLSGDSKVAIYSLTQATLASNSGNADIPFSSTKTLTLSGSTNANGIAFDGDGSIYLGTSSGLFKYNPTTWALIDSKTNILDSSVDLSSCNTPASLAVTKNVVGRSDASDQFTLELKPTGGAVFADATTSGSATGTQTQQVGPVPVLAGTSYTFSEKMATGSKSALADYTTTYTCTDGSKGNTTSGTVTLAAGATVSCEFTNTPKSVSIVATKVWVVNGQSYANGAQPQGLSAQLTLTGPTGATATDQAWGTARTGYAWGSSATVSETTTIDPSLVGCRLTASTVTKVNGATTTTALPYTAKLDRSATSVEVTNTVTCESKLDLVKQVSFGTADPSVWTLTGTPGSGSPVSGKTGVSAVVTPDTAYVLSESGGPATYAQQGQWSCAVATGTDTNGTPVYGSPSAATSATVPFGKRVQCTVTNATAKLTVLKHVSNTNGGTLTADQWSLTSTPQAGVSGLNPATFDGSEQPTASNTQEVLPGHVYAVTESPKAGAPAYLQTKVQQYTGDPSLPIDQSDASKWKDIDASKVSTEAGKQQVIRIVNADVATPGLPITGAEMGQLALWTGGGLALAALATLAWMIRRRRHDGTGLLDD